MAGAGLLALLDDISTLLDDVAAMSKVAGSKTAGIAGDDLAVNAEGLVGIAPARELPIVGKVALGSAANKLVLIPLALALPKAVVTPLLMLGGAFLCYEGVHKVLHKKGDEDATGENGSVDDDNARPLDPKALEKQRVKQSIITDIILSAEIIAVALGSVADQPLATQAGVLIVVGFGMTIIIYGLVAAIVKLDDLGLYLQRSASAGELRHSLGRVLVERTPTLMKGISIVGTLAMFLVGGDIILHGIPAAEHAVHEGLESVVGKGSLLSLGTTVASLVVGALIGAVVLLVVEAAKKAFGRSRANG